MKLLILGLDGLEYNLVKEWNLENLKQKQCGKIAVPVNKKKKVPVSPEVWASFLTGKVQSGLDFEKKGWRGKAVSTLEFVRSHIPLGFGLAKHLHARATFPKLDDKTFVDYLGVEEINAPYYSYDHKGMDLIRLFEKEHWTINRLRHEFISHYEVKKTQLLDAIENSNARAVFAFLHYPDLIQHLFFTSIQAKTTYEDLDRFVERLKHQARCDLIILSDHGYDFIGRTHSLYGFYSSARVLNDPPESITDFYAMILEVLGENARTT